jgi:hypothetical protein
VPFYPDDKVKVSILPTDRSERDERTGIVTVIGFSPIRGQGLVKHVGFGYSRVEEVGKVQLVGGEPEAKFLKQIAHGVTEWDYIRWDDIAEKPLQFPPEPHKHGLEDLLQSGALTGQVIKFDGTNWTPSWVDWTEIGNKPSQFPPTPHTHTRSDITDFAHASTHASGGSDPITGNLDANARVGVMNAGTLVGARRRINFIAGTNITLNIVDDATNEKVDVTINSQSAQSELFVSATAHPQVIVAGSYFVLARITVPAQKPNLKVIAIAVSPFYGTGAMGNAHIVLYNETDGVTVATWGSGAGPVYLEPNQSFNLGGKTVSFRLSHGAPGAQECWGSVSFKLTT